MTTQHNAESDGFHPTDLPPAQPPVNPFSASQNAQQQSPQYPAQPGMEQYPGQVPQQQPQYPQQQPQYPQQQPQYPQQQPQYPQQQPQYPQQYPQYPQQYPQQQYPQQQYPQQQYPQQQPMAMPQINVVMANNNTAVGQAGAVAVAARKSVFLALVLTFFFGPLGMFYSTVKGAVIMLIISTVLALLTAGISIAITWPVSIIWGAVAADAHNKRGVVV